MEHKSKHSSAMITGRIDTYVHNVSDLKDAIPDWESLSSSERMSAVRDVEPEYSDVVYNVTVDRFHQYFVDNLDPDQTDAKSNITASWFALGTDGASGTATTDTDLNNRVFAKAVTDHADNSKDLLCSTFVDSTEANGNDLTELGLFSGDPSNLANDDVFMLNHTSFSSITKDNSKTVTFDVTLSFSDA